MSKHDLILTNRLSAGCDEDKFVFFDAGKTVVRFYGNRYTDEQATNKYIMEKHGIAGR